MSSPMQEAANGGWHTLTMEAGTSTGPGKEASLIPAEAGRTEGLILTVSSPGKVWYSQCATPPGYQAVQSFPWPGQLGQSQGGNADHPREVLMRFFCCLRRENTSEPSLGWWGQKVSRTPQHPHRASLTLLLPLAAPHSHLSPDEPAQGGQQLSA